MTNSEIKESIKGILVATLKHEEFEMTDSTTANDVKGWDSLSHMIIIREVEACFNIKFKLKDLNKLVDIGSLVQIVEKKLS